MNNTNKEEKAERKRLGAEYLATKHEWIDAILDGRRATTRREVLGSMRRIERARRRGTTIIRRLLDNAERAR